MIRMHCETGKAATIETYSQFSFMASNSSETQRNGLCGKTIGM